MTSELAGEARVNSFYPLHHDGVATPAGVESRLDGRSARRPATNLRIAHARRKS